MISRLSGLTVAIYLCIATVSKGEALDPQAQPSEETIGRATLPLVAWEPTYRLIFGVGHFVYPLQSKRFLFSSQLVGTFENVASLKFNFRRDLEDHRSAEWEGKWSNFYDSYYGEGINTDVHDFSKIHGSTMILGWTGRHEVQNQKYAGLFWQAQARREWRVEGGTRSSLFDDENRGSFGLLFEQDSRDHRLNANRGEFGQIRLRFLPSWLVGLAEPRESVIQVEAESRWFHPGPYRSVQAVRVKAATSWGNPSYLYRYALGGGDSMRGYFANRFRGNKMGLLSTEWRQPLVDQTWLAVAFFEAGTVGDDDLKTVRTASGVGVRYGLPPDQSIRARVDFGFSSDQAGLYLLFNEEF